MALRHFLTLRDLSTLELNQILQRAIELKRKQHNNEVFQPFLGKVMGMIFEKSSTRTRVSFEAGMSQFGGSAIFLSSRDTQLGRGEPIEDSARVISSMLDIVMIRTFGHDIVERFASYSKVPVINGLTDEFHPVQLMADWMTMIEHDKANNPKVAYIGDGNNMAHSWLMLASKMGFRLSIATPKGYEVDEDILKIALENAKISGAKISITNDPKAAVKDADVVTTDTWASMGQEDEKKKRELDFKGFQVDTNLMNLAKNDAIFLHCLPAYRGQEVSEEVLESPASVIFDEAENRLHAQKGIMVWLDAHRG